MNFMEDAWLGGFFEGPVYSLAPGEAGAPFSPQKARELRQALAGAGFAYAKIDCRDVASVWLAEEAGMRLVDTAVTLKARQLDLPKAGLPPAGFARADEAQAVAALAGRAFGVSRFHLDPLVPKQTANAIKEAWAANFFAGGRGDYMVVARPGGEPAGFLQLIVAPDGELIIDLLAVAQEARRQKLARSMLAFALGNIPGVKRLTVGTQLANQEALAFYLGVGFSIHSAAYVFHYHPNLGG